MMLASYLVLGFGIIAFAFGWTWERIERQTAEKDAKRWEKCSEQSYERYINLLSEARAMVDEELERKRKAKSWLMTTITKGDIIL